MSSNCCAQKHDTRSRGITQLSDDNVNKMSDISVVASVSSKEGEGINRHMSLHVVVWVSAVQVTLKLNKELYTMTSAARAPSS